MQSAGQPAQPPLSGGTHTHPTDDAHQLVILFQLFRFPRVFYDVTYTLHGVGEIKKGYLLRYSFQAWQVPGGMGFLSILSRGFAKPGSGGRKKKKGN